VTACQAVRTAGPDDAVAGVQPSFVAVPASTADVSAILRAAAELNLAVIPRGQGTRLHWGMPPARCDLVVDLTAMNQVIEHAAGDLVATVQAGVTLEALSGVLSLAGQRLALDPAALGLPSAEPGSAGFGGAGDGTASHGTAHHGTANGKADGRGTIGGMIAAGAAGPLRLRYGSPRDLLIGITVVRADGTVAKAGGKVVKNVAGYDLGKLFAGSRGTLGVITEATFRLHPVPAATAYVTMDCATPALAGSLLSAAADSALVPVAAEIDWPDAGSPIRLGFALEGDVAGVAQRSAEMTDRLASIAERGGRQISGSDRPASEPERLPQLAAPVTSQQPPEWWGAGPAARSDGTVLQVAFWPGETGQVLTGIRKAAAAAGLDPAIGGSPAAAVLYVFVSPQASPASVATFSAGLRDAVGHRRPAEASPATPGASRGTGRPPGLAGQPGSPARASVVVLHAPAAVRALVDMFGPVPALGLMRAVKAQFDPDGRMAPGRFAGGI
jgi:glycolate oxidase FAD binding subunit